MERKPVESSQVASIGYDAAARLLEVEFKNSGVYQYKEVPQDLAEAFVRSDSIGRFLAQHIKGRFEHQKVA